MAASRDVLIPVDLLADYHIMDESLSAQCTTFCNRRRPRGSSRQGKLQVIGSGGVFIRTIQRDDGKEGSLRLIKEHHPKPMHAF